MQIDFTLEQLGILDKAIQQLPFYVAAPLIAHINAEIQKQQQIMDTPIDEEKVFPKTHQQNGI
jgi:hypothetical protein